MRNLKIKKIHPEFIKITVIENLKVIIILPWSQAITCGETGSFGDEVTDAELTLELTDAGYEDTVENASWDKRFLLDVFMQLQANLC